MTGAGPMPAGPPVRHRPGHLLLQGLHDPVADGEHGGPQHHQRAVVGFIDAPVGHAQEHVGGHPAHHEPHRHRHRPFRQRVDLSGACQQARGANLHVGHPGKTMRDGPRLAHPPSPGCHRWRMAENLHGCVTSALSDRSPMNTSILVKRVGAAAVAALVAGGAGRRLVAGGVRPGPQQHQTRHHHHHHHTATPLLPDDRRRAPVRPHRGLGDHREFGGHPGRPAQGDQCRTVQGRRPVCRRGPRPRRRHAGRGQPPPSTSGTFEFPFRVGWAPTGAPGAGPRTRSSAAPASHACLRVDAGHQFGSVRIVRDSI